jgi:predicted metalloprotease
VHNTDGGAIDRLTLLSINDIEEYWKQAYGESLNGSFAPVEALVSYDSDNPNSPMVCSNKTYHNVNAFFTSVCDLIAWDRGVFMPLGQRYFGDMYITEVLAHEYGHALQQMAKLVTRKDPTIVREQQADCFAGVYLWWVAAGKSPRFTLSTVDGLDKVLEGVITTRDPVMDSDTGMDDEHGSALDRISAFQMGFFTGAPACAAINKQEIEQRRGDLPTTLRVDPHGEVQTGEAAINQDTLSTLMELMGKRSPAVTPRNPFLRLPIAVSGPTPWRPYTCSQARHTVANAPRQSVAFPRKCLGLKVISRCTCNQGVRTCSQQPGRKWSHRTCSRWIYNGTVQFLSCS